MSENWCWYDCNDGASNPIGYEELAKITMDLYEARLNRIIRILEKFSKLLF